jgi:TM2 domain-containing membrane protein YozV
MTTTMEQLARRATDAFKNTAGFVRCEPRPPTGLEFRFTNGPDAERFKLAREIEPGSGRWSIDASNLTVVINDRSPYEPAQASPAPVQPNIPPPAQNPPPAEEGDQTRAPSVADPQPASRFYPAFFLCLFLGVFGVHRFYNGQVKSGLVQLVTFGGCGVWWLIDMVLILVGKFKDKTGTVIPNINPKLSWAVFIAVVVIGIASRSVETGPSAGGLGSSSGASGQGASPSNSRLVGVYECPSPMWALQLNSDGSYIMEARDSGSTFRGTWSASGSSGLLNGTYPSKATMSFTVQGDGAIVVEKYGYTFVKTR